MATKEKVNIQRPDQFREMDDALTLAMAELDSTIERVSAIFQSEQLELNSPENETESREIESQQLDATATPTESGDESSSQET